MALDAVVPATQLVFLLTCLATLVDLTVAADPYNTAQAYNNIFRDPGVFGRFLESQVAPATESELLPTGSAPNILPLGFPKYKIHRGKRADVYKIMRPGNASSGLPKAAQGSFWQDGVIYDEELVSTYGPYDPKQRFVETPAWQARLWGFHDTSAEKAPGQAWYYPSGASHANLLATYQGTLNIFFNEDATFARLSGTAALFGLIKITSPTWFFDWTMTLEPDGVSWRRESRAFGLPTAVGNYVLRPVVTADNQPGRYYDQWVKAFDGADFFYVDYAL